METKRKISRCALRLFLKDGYEALSMRKIAACAEISATAIYRHYQDKKDLVQDLVREGFAELGKYLYGSRAGSRAGGARARLLQALDDYKRFAVDHPEYYRLIFMSDDNVDFRDLPEERKGESERTFVYLTELCVDLAATLGAAPPTEAAVRGMALALWAQAHGLAALYTQGRLARAEFEGVFGVALDFAVRGWEAAAA